MKDISGSRLKMWMMGSAHMKGVCALWPPA
jgi:hypothetical protein